MEDYGFLLSTWIFNCSWPVLWNKLCSWDVCEAQLVLSRMDGSSFVPENGIFLSRAGFVPLICMPGLCRDIPRCYNLMEGLKTGSTVIWHSSFLKLFWLFYILCIFISSLATDCQFTPPCWDFNGDLILIYRSIWGKLPSWQYWGFRSMNMECLSINLDMF